MRIPAMAFLGIFFYSISSVCAQTTYLQLGQEDYHLLDRLETRSGEVSSLLQSSLKPISRKAGVTFLENLPDHLVLSRIDQYNVAHAVSVSSEWSQQDDAAINSRLPWFKTFYKKQADFLHVKIPDFFLVANPVISAQGMYENNTPDTRLLSSSRGVELRGHISKRIGFYTYLSDNQEQLPSYYRTWIQQRQAVPGADYFQTPGAKTVDYMQASGYVDFSIVKDHVNATFGFGKHFIGDGIRSLILSDFSAGSTFLRLNTRIGKWNYQNTFLELINDYTRGADQNLPRKYAAIHHLSIPATRWLQVGLFESTVFGRTNNFNAGYLIPVMYWHAAEHPNGINDNTNLGFNFKAIALKHVQLYGQLFVDNVSMSQLFKSDGFWDNRYGFQVGAKYFDAFTLRNLDLQVEYNHVRPFTYSSGNQVSDYTHYNQPLAHPLGANFREVLAVLRYQPVQRLYLSLRANYYQQGTDAAGKNYGANPFLSNRTRTTPGGTDNDYNYVFLSGDKVNCMSLGFNASYELVENLFIDLGGMQRSYYNTVSLSDIKNASVYLGFRLNIARRDYMQF